MTEYIEMTRDEWYNQVVEIKLKEEDDFLKIKETLTRIGVGVVKQGVKSLYQTCHILQKQGKYYIVHFKEMSLLDGKSVNLSENDVKRRNKIIHLLEAWGLLEVLDADKIKEKNHKDNIKIIPFAEKSEWNLVPKYTIGG